MDDCSTQGVVDNARKHDVSCRVKCGDRTRELRCRLSCVYVSLMGGGMDCATRGSG